MKEHGHEYTLSADGEGYVHNDDCAECLDQKRLDELQRACGVFDEESEDEPSE